MKKLFIFSLLFSLAACQSEVCNCADQWLEMTQALKKAEAKGQSVDKLLQKYQPALKKCENLDAKMSAAEKEQMLEELRACDSYQKIGKE